MGKHLNFADLTIVRQKLKKSGKRIVFTYGTFDLIHSGHAAYLLKAKLKGDILIVGVATNKSKRNLRGNGFPLIDQKNREELLHHFKFVDYTIGVDIQNLLPTLKRMKPDVFYTIGADWKSHLRKNKESEFVKSYNGTIIKNKKTSPYVSASAVVERVADIKIKEIIEYFFGKIKIDLSKGDWEKRKFSGFKTSIRSESLYFGDHSGDLGFFSKEYFGEVISESKLAKIVNRAKLDDKTVVLTSGACDLLHAGHARFYAKAKELGDILVLALPSDKIIRKQKGRGRPIVNEKSRAELMAFFDFVDYVVIFDDESVLPVIERVKPDIFFTVKEDWNEVDSIRKLIPDWDGKIVAVPPQSPNLSSSRLIRKASGLRVKQLFKEVLSEAEKISAIKD